MVEPERREVSTANAPKPRFSYSQGIISGGFLFIAGQVPIDPLSGHVPEGFRDQAHQTLMNLSAIAHAGGATLSNAVRVNVYLENLESIHELEEIYPHYFSAPYPVRTTVAAGLRGYLIEIDAIVALNGEDSE